MKYACIDTCKSLWLFYTTERNTICRSLLVRLCFSVWPFNWLSFNVRFFLDMQKNWFGHCWSSGMILEVQIKKFMFYNFWRRLFKWMCVHICPGLYVFDTHIVGTFFIAWCKLLVYLYAVWSCSCSLATAIQMFRGTAHYYYMCIR
jgi:hypothetical protein